MGATDQFTRQEMGRILDVSDKQLNYWEKLGLIAPRKSGAKFYDFRDLISLRTAKQLIDTGVSASRLKRSLAALDQQLSTVSFPLTELRIRSNGKDVLVERSGGVQLEPLSGQFVLNFDTRELREKISVMPERSADDWFSLALQCEAASGNRAEAIAAYERAIEIDPGHVDALINRGMLAYEQGDLRKAGQSFQKAVELAPDNPIARFNLGSVLEETGRLDEARKNLREAVRINPRYADAHYNLAFVCDKLGTNSEAREHWALYVKLEPSGTWSDYARRRLRSIR